MCRNGRLSASVPTITRFHATGAIAGRKNSSSAFRMAVCEAVQAEHHDRREDHAREADAERRRGSRRAQQLRREHHRDAVTAESPANESHQTVEATRQARSRSPFVQQLVEDRHERRAERRVGDQRADQVRDLVRDGEGVDRLALHREDPRGRRLAEHADEPARAGRDGEQRGRDRHAAPLGCLGAAGAAACEAADSRRVRIGARDRGGCGRARPRRLQRMPLRPGRAPDLMRAIETLMRPSRTESASFDALRACTTRAGASRPPASRPRSRTAPSAAAPC